MANVPGRTGSVITVDGQEMHPRDAWWVVFDPNGEPVKAFPSTIVIKDRIATAARCAWYGDEGAILALNEGFRIELMGTKRFRKDVFAKLSDED